MHTHAPNRIVELAEIVRDNVHKLDVFFTSAGLPTPSFDVDLPSELPPEIDVSRNLILIATDELQDLMLGPSRIAEGHPPQVCRHGGLFPTPPIEIMKDVGFTTFVEHRTRWHPSHLSLPNRFEAPPRRGNLLW